MRLTCGRLEQCGVQSECLSTNFGSIKIRPVLLLPPVSCHQSNMSNIAKSTSPVAPVTTESKDWTKASMPELQSGSEDELDVLDAKAKECCRRKQVKREEKQRREEAERRVREEVEARAREEAEAERKAREEAERQLCEQAEKDWAEVQQRAAEVAARQKVLAQEASKKRARQEPEAGPSGDRSNNAR